MKMRLDVEMPDGLTQAFLQHLRDFDVRHPECVFALFARGEMSPENFERAVRAVEPPFRFTEEG